MGDVLESAINDDQRLKMINAEGTKEGEGQHPMA
jgi:hypothetical protein